MSSPAETASMTQRVPPLSTSRPARSGITVNDRVPQGGVHDGLINTWAPIITRVSANEPPARVPSARECSSCDVAADCSMRVASPIEARSS